jgi:hypothetical protein
MTRTCRLRPFRGSTAAPLRLFNTKNVRFVTMLIRILKTRMTCSPNLFGGRNYPVARNQPIALPLQVTTAGRIENRHPVVPKSRFLDPQTMVRVLDWCGIFINERNNDYHLVRQHLGRRWKILPTRSGDNTSSRPLPTMSTTKSYRKRNSLNGQRIAKWTVLPKTMLLLPRIQLRQLNLTFRHTMKTTSLVRAPKSVRYSSPRRARILTNGGRFREESITSSESFEQRRRRRATNWGKQCHHNYRPITFYLPMLHQSNVVCYFLFLGLDNININRRMFFHPPIARQKLIARPADKVVQP